jgi:hypothetical protein
MNPTRRSAAAIAAIVTVTGGLLAGSGILATAASAADSFIGPLTHTKVVASTVPANGDQNPYGVAVVPRSTGNLVRGDVLVSNFNDGGNIQGTGSTIVQVNPRSKTATVFASISDPACPGGVGLTTALVALRNGWVIVGSLPTAQTADGTTVISGSGCLIVLDSHGNVAETITGYGINGPWDMTALDLGGISELFVTNVLNGIAGSTGVVHQGTVVRLLITSGPEGVPQVIGHRQIGSGFPEELNSAALIIGPTGVGLGPDGTLYVADTLGGTTGRIAGIPDAVLRFSDDGTGHTVSENIALNGPLGLAIAPNGDILTVNSGDGNMVETTPGGATVAVNTVDTNMGGAGNLFGLAVKPGADAVYFVDDFGSDNNLQLLF